MRRYDAEIWKFQAEVFNHAADLNALCSAIVHLDYQGTLTVSRGPIRRNELDAVAQGFRSSDGDGQTTAGVELPPVLARLVHSRH